MTQDLSDARRAIEALVLVADDPLPPQLLAQLLELPVATIELICAELAAEYEAEGRGFVLVRVAGGYRYQTHPDQAPYVERFVLEGQSARLSNAALETLAIVAYKQPISRMQVAAIRGVNVDGVMRTLQQRGYVDEVGRDPGPGNAVLYGTTQLFLERLGLDALADLPPLGQFVPGADVVEALEHTLRADPEIRLEADAEPEAETAAEPEAASEAEADVDDAPHSIVLDDRAAIEAVAVEVVVEPADDRA
jgi:segregation and condensation protein B